MNQSGIFEDRQTVQKLLCEYLYELGAEPLELVLLDELI